VVGIRAFATLTDKEKDESEQVLQKFIQYARVPILNMESATAHPLQALADALTLTDLTLPKKTKGSIDMGTTSESIAPRGWKFICPNDGAYRCRICYC
jgi:ornithine carbamoyltransferase